MTAGELERLHNLITTRVMANRLQNIKSDQEILIAGLLLAILQGSAQITEVSVKRDTQEVSDYRGEIVANINHGSSFTFTIQTWN